jgi:hypothetical protein
LLTVVVLALCSTRSASADSALRRKRRVLEIDSVDHGSNNKFHSLLDSDLWGRHLGAGADADIAAVSGGRMNRSKNMIKGPLKSGAKKTKGGSKATKGGKDMGMKGGMMMKGTKKTYDIDAFWDSAIREGELSMSMSMDVEPTPSPTRAGAIVAPTFSPTPDADAGVTVAPTRAGAIVVPTTAPVATPVVTDAPVAVPVVTDMPVSVPVTTPAPSPIFFPAPTVAPVEETIPPVTSTAAPVTTLTSTPTTAPVDSAPPADSPSLSPFAVCSLLPRSEAFSAILENITSTFLLTDPATPQGSAYDFLVNQDPAAVDPCTYPTVEQRYAAVTFFRSTDGQNWADSTGWLSAESECNWRGVVCNSEGLFTELILRKCENPCAHFGHVCVCVCVCV